MGSARKTGTNENIQTYDSAGGKDYTALTTWEQATDIDLVTGTQSEVLECYKGAHNDEVSFSGATANSSYFRILRPATGEGHSGIPKIDGSVVAFTRSGTDSACFFLNENNIQLQDLVVEFDTTHTGSVSYCYFLVNSSNDQACVGCLALEGSRGDTGNSHVGFAGYDNHYFIDCLAHNLESDGTGDGFLLLGAANCYNCTSTNNGRGMAEESIANPVAKNCISSHNTTDWFGTWTKTTCTAENDEPTYVNSGGDDFHLDSSDTVAKGNGTDLSGDANYAFDDDIDGDTMSDWPIGFDEPVAGGADEIGARFNRIGHFFEPQMYGAGMVNR